MKITFFGGSFDPPHAGHRAVADGALRSGRCDRILWVPAFAPPHKLDRERAAFEHRYNMVHLLIADDPRQQVSDLEYRLRRVPSYTFELLEYMEQHISCTPLLLIGADSLLQLHTWHRAQELAERFEILTYPRAGEAVTMDSLRCHWDEKTAKKLMKTMLDGKNFEISSTNLRFSMAKSEDWSHIIYMTDPVVQYCRRNKLYSEGAKSDER